MSPIADFLKTTVAQLGRDTAGFVYPPVCVACGVGIPSGAIPIAGNPDSERFCRDCVDALRCTIDHACLTCGAPVGPHLATWGCRYCRRDDFAFERVVALGVYERELQECCKRIKEPFEEPLAAGLADLLWDAHHDVLSEAEIDVIVPVPHHWWERTTRRHLPPVTVGRVLARRLSVPMTAHILAKRRRTPAQSSLPPSRRRKNLRNAFQMTGRAKLGGLTVLLTDDILTTGTTADCAARVLQEAGAKRVLVAVIARGLGQTHASQPSRESTLTEQP